MDVYTGCPGCGKELRLKYGENKEIYAPVDKETPVALAICEYCRQKMRISIKITKGDEHGNNHGN